MQPYLHPRHLHLIMIVVFGLSVSCSDDSASRHDATPLSDGTVIDGGAVDSTAGDADAVQAQCNQPSKGSSMLCLERTRGRAGDTVEMEIHLLAKKGCSELEQSFGEITYDTKRFALINSQKTIEDCLLRELRSSPDAHVYWHIFTKAAIGSKCPDSIKPAKVDKLSLKIAADTPVGTYTFSWRKALVSGVTKECEGSGGIDGILEVVP